MDFDVRQTGDGTYELSLDEFSVGATTEELEALLFRLLEIVHPEQIVEKDQRHKKFLDRLRDANGIGIQALLRSGSYDDVLVLLRMSDADNELTDKLYGNLTEKSIKLYVEDLVFKYKDGVPGHLADAALNRLMRAMENLEADGAMAFETAPPAETPETIKS